MSLPGCFTSAFAEINRPFSVVQPTFALSGSEDFAGHDAAVIAKVASDQVGAFLARSIGYESAAENEIFVMIFSAANLLFL